MRTNLKTKSRNVEVGLLLDSSGSMLPLVDEVISGVNAEIEKLRSADVHGVTPRVTIATFPAGGTGVSTTSVVHYITKSAELDEIGIITRDDYRAMGSTPLYDALGEMVSTLSVAAEDRSDVVLVIFTDGEENASREFGLDAIRKLLQDKQSRGWRVTYIGVTGLERQGRDIGARYVQSFDLSNADGIKYGLRSAGTGIACYLASVSSKVEERCE